MFPVPDLFPIHQLEGWIIPGVFKVLSFCFGICFLNHPFRINELGI